MGKHSHPGRFLLLAAAFLTLLAAMWAGLLRMDLEIPMLQPGLSLAHGPLMVCGFLGILISLERSVALHRWWAYGAPILTAAGSLCLVAGVGGRTGPLLVLLGSVALAANFVAILRRQMALFTLTMALGALAWFIGNIFWNSGAEIPTLVHWWAGFLVLTIVGERLELSRLSSPSSGTKYFLVSGGIYLAGLIYASVDLVRGMPVAGLGILLLTLWLLRNDVARRTVRLAGLPRFIAIHLLCGYFWMAVGAVFWIRADRLFVNSEWQAFHYDAMLHSIFLGFVFSMIFAHAPIIFPAITSRPLPYRRSFYAPGAMLHLALLLRIGSDLANSFVAYRWSGLLLVMAILLFLANNALSLLAGARQVATPASPPALG
ncbi:MAG: hypothetical protein HYX73_04850 [Acidobacteria bacterium]|nr:hypothetical protein [Acidobacteriota bacterium]